MIVLLHHTADKYLERLNTADKERIKTALKKLGHEPPEGDIISVSGQPGVFRTRGIKDDSNRFKKRTAYYN